MKHAFQLCVFFLICIYSVKCSEICNGYYSDAGSYNSSKYCSDLSRSYCCGSCTDRYCCNSLLERLDQSVCTTGYAYSNGFKSNDDSFPLITFWWVYTLVFLVVLVLCCMRFIWIPLFLEKRRIKRQIESSPSTSGRINRPNTTYTQTQRDLSFYSSSSNPTKPTDPTNDLPSYWLATVSQNYPPINQQDQEDLPTINNYTAVSFSTSDDRVTIQNETGKY